LPSQQSTRQQSAPARPAATEYAVLALLVGKGVTGLGGQRSRGGAEHLNGCPPQNFALHDVASPAVRSALKEIMAAKKKNAILFTFM